MLRIQFRLQPYKDRVNNEIEDLALISGFCTMYWTLLMIGDEISGFLILLTIILLGVNSYFIIQWTYLFLLSLNFKNKYYQIFMKIFGIIICKHGWNKEKSTQRPSMDSESKNNQLRKTPEKSLKRKSKAKSKHRRRIRGKSK